MSDRKSSINIKPIKPSSESHNNRTHPMEHIYADRSINNQVWINEKVYARRQTILALCKEQSGRNMQSNATPIREAVINLDSQHSMADLHRVASVLKTKFRIDVFQMFLHRDEGHHDKETGAFKVNHHAHLICDWQNKKTGKMLRLGKLDMVKMQTIVADVLEMERGKEGSQAIRLEAQAYKATKECEAQEAKTEALRQESAKLEQDNEQKFEEGKKIGAEVAALERKKQRLLQVLLRRCKAKLQIWKNRLKAPEKLTELYNQTMANLVVDMQKETQNEVENRQKDIEQAEKEHQKETPGKTPAGWFNKTFRSGKLAREDEMIAEREQSHRERQRARQMNIDKLRIQRTMQKEINDRMKAIDPRLYEAQEQITRDNLKALHEQVRSRRRERGQRQDTGIEL